MTRPISELFRHEGTIYVYCSSPEVKRQFTRHLIEQGFVFGDGILPGRRAIDELMCIHRDHKIGFCGFVCHMQCGNLKDPRYVDADCYQGCTRVDYARFAAGFDEYVIQGKRTNNSNGPIVEYW